MCRRDADGTLVYLLPLAPDARVPFVNPFASVGPVGAMLCEGHSWGVPALTAVPDA